LNNDENKKLYRKCTEKFSFRRLCACRAKAHTAQKTAKNKTGHVWSRLVTFGHVWSHWLSLVPIATSLRALHAFRECFPRKNKNHTQKYRKILFAHENTRNPGSDEPASDDFLFVPIRAIRVSLRALRPQPSGCQSQDFLCFGAVWCGLVRFQSTSRN
jgi:hypothetical protein